MNSFKTSFFWFRRDLRFTDNPGLWHALEREENVTLLFIFDINITDELSKDDARINFIYNRLELINAELVKRNSSLLVLKGEPLKIWKELNELYQIKNVFVNKDYEPYAVQRDTEIQKFLAAQNIPLYSFNEQLVFEPDEILTNQGKPYSVFTPYKKKWLNRFYENRPSPWPCPKYINLKTYKNSFPSLVSLGFSKSKIKVLDYNLNHLSEYGKFRDYPARNSTSFLGPHLRFGAIGIRELIAQITPNSEAFLNELIWREFFKQILFHYPHVVTENFYRKYDNLLFRNNEIEFRAWCKGKTGYPIVDAGMRQLNASGFMHNRVRMVTASFLCKHLLIDWRWGEAYFAQKLLDYDLSSNNGNWQWAASTGCDASPYFRVFNPETQMNKFDKTKTYVQRWVPEYETSSYVKPIVEHSEARNRAITAYRKALNNNIS